MNVLSLFDGMSCGQIALKQMGVTVDNYYAAEIDKHAIACAKHNFPNMVHLGDVTKWEEWDIDWSKIDLLLGGSPCQGFSFAGKQLAFDDPRSMLFFVFVDIWHHIQKHNPKAHFLLENVRMKAEHEAVITSYMKVHPITINSALVSAQNRVRLYWTNIANEPYGLFGDMRCAIKQPQDQGILLRDVLEDEVDNKYFLSEKAVKTINKHGAVKHLDNDKSQCLLAGYHKMGGRDQQYIVAQQGCVKFGRTDEAKQIRKQNMAKGVDHTPFAQKEITSVDYEKMNTLTTATNKDNLIITHSTQPRMGKGQGGKGHLFKTDQKSYCLDTGNSQAVEITNKVIQLNKSIESGGKQPYQPNRIYDTNGISPCLTTDSRSPAIMKDEMKIRRLTPLECQRLQTAPEWYDMTVASDTQRYRMLGNGWTVNVIVWILSHAEFA